MQRERIELDCGGSSVPFHEGEDGRPKVGAWCECGTRVLRRRTAEECTRVVVAAVIGSQVAQEIERRRRGRRIHRVALDHALELGARLGLVTTAEQCPRSLVCGSRGKR